MGEGKGLRWFARRHRNLQPQSRDWSLTREFGRLSLSAKLISLMAVFLTSSSVTLVGFSLTVPSELHVFLDAKFSAGVLAESLLNATLSLLLARLALVLSLLLVAFFSKSLDVDVFRNALRSVYVFSFRNNFHQLLYPGSTLLLAALIYCALSFGPFIGLIYLIIFVSSLIVVGGLLLIGDVFALVLAHKARSISRTIEYFQHNEQPVWLNIALIVAVLSVSSFALGLGSSAKRHAEVSRINLDGTVHLGSVIAVTDDGMIVSWMNSEEVGSSYSYLPLQFQVSASPE
jgi:hypothetical protein